MKSILLFLLFFGSINLYAGDGLDFGVEIGLSTPNDEINNVYNKDYQQIITKVTSNKNDTIAGKMLRDGASLGYHIGVRIKIPLKSWFKLQGSIGYHKFSQSDIEVRDPNSNVLLATLFTYQNIIPITAGADLYYINTKPISFYVSGELVFNQFSFTTEVKNNRNDVVSIPIQNTGAYNNLGVAAGTGFDINLSLVKLNLDVRYHLLNLINSIDDDKFKDYISVSTAIYF